MESRPSLSRPTQARTASWLVGSTRFVLVVALDAHCGVTVEASKVCQQRLGRRRHQSGRRTLMPVCGSLSSCSCLLWQMTPPRRGRTHVNNDARRASKTRTRSRARRPRSPLLPARGPHNGPVAAAERRLRLLLPDLRPRSVKGLQSRAPRRKKRPIASFCRVLVGGWHRGHAGYQKILVRCRLCA